MWTFVALCWPHQVVCQTGREDNFPRHPLKDASDFLGHGVQAEVWKSYSMTTSWNGPDKLLAEIQTETTYKPYIGRYLIPDTYLPRAHASQRAADHGKVCDTEKFKEVTRRQRKPESPDYDKSSGERELET